MIRKNHNELHYYYGAVMTIIELDGGDRELAALVAIGKRLGIDPEHKEFKLGRRSIVWRIKKNLKEYHEAKDRKQAEEAKLERAQQQALRPYNV